MSVVKELLYNTLWIAFGRMGVSLIGFLLVPLYTAYLAPVEYGIVDILQTTLAFSLPIITLQTGDAIQTFLLKKEIGRSEVITHTLIVLLICWFFSLLFYPLLNSLLEGYAWVLYTLMFLQGVTSLCFPYYKGINQVKTSSIISIIETITLLAMMIILLTVLNKGLQGFFIAMISARAVAVLLYFFTIPIWDNFNISKLEYDTFKVILIFSIPLIPNMIGWWINNLSDRYIIKYLMGIEANGIYAVATKFPSIISIFSTILISSWMITALQNDSKKNTDLFRAMSLIFSSAMVIISLFVILVLPFLFSIYIQSEAYASAQQYIPMLLLAGVLSAISSLFGVTYLGENDTKMAAITTLTSGLINVLLNFMLIPLMGIMGAVWATFISFIIIVFLRFIYVRKRTSLDIPFTTVLILIILPTAYFLNSKEMLNSDLVLLFVALSFIGGIFSIIYNTVKYKLITKLFNK